MDEDKRESLDTLRGEVLRAGAGAIEDWGYQHVLMTQVEELKGSEGAGDFASALGRDEAANQFWKKALASADPGEWGYERLLEKAEAEDQLREFRQNKFDNAEDSSEIMRYGEKLGLEEKLISDRAASAVKMKFSKIDQRRGEMMCSYSEGDRAESIYRHDMSHAINAAVETGNLDLIKEGYRDFMQSVKADNDSQYVERLIDHYEAAKSQFAEKGVELDPEDFYFDTEILDICESSAAKSEYGYAWGTAAKVAELIGEEVRADRYRAKYEEMTKKDDDSDTKEKSFEDLVNEGEFANAFSFARRQDDVEKAKTVYDRALAEMQERDADSYTSGCISRMAEAVGDTKTAKLYKVASEI